MENARKRTSMSVPEMGRLLGLCKTESYWLIKKNYFKRNYHHSVMTNTKNGLRSIQLQRMLLLKGLD